jgi:hypothetical protein
MSEAIFKPDLAIAELQGSIRAPEFEWILLDAKAAISAVKVAFLLLSSGVLSLFVRE